MVTLQNIWILQNVLGKFTNVALVINGNANECRYVFTKLFGVHQRQIPLNDTARFQLFYALHHRGRGKFDLVGDIRQTSATVFLQNMQYF